MDPDDNGELVSPWEDVSQELPRDLKVLVGLEEHKMSDLTRKFLDATSSTWFTSWASFLFSLEALHALGYPTDAQAIIQAGEGL